MKKMLSMGQKAVLLFVLNWGSPLYACCGFDDLWYVEGSFGMASYRGLSPDEGQTALGRLALGGLLLPEFSLKLGIEAGIQNGNTMRFPFDEESIDALGGVPIETQLRPMLDILVLVKTEALEDFPLFAWLKGGVVYQQLHVDRDSVNDIKIYSPEFFAGLGYKMSEQTDIHLGYQLIWGEQPTLEVDSLTETAVLTHLPLRQALMLGFSHTFDK